MKVQNGMIFMALLAYFSDSGGRNLAVPELDQQLSRRVFFVREKYLTLPSGLPT